MFGIVDHVTGAATVRTRRFFLKLRNKPDLSFVTPNLAIGGVCNLESLQKNEFATVLDLREEDGHSSNDVEKYSITYLRIGIRDRGIPSFEQTKLALDWIISNLNKGRNVFVHCNLGRGRATLMACLYLVYQGKDPKSVIEIVKKVRPYMFLNQVQSDYLHEFHKKTNSHS